MKFLMTAVCCCVLTAAQPLSAQETNHSHAAVSQDSSDWGLLGLLGLLGLMGGRKKQPEG